jgi:glycine cleavage system H protein
MSNTPDDRLYTSDHEWAKAAEGDEALIVIGITDHAQKALGDITYVELPEVGDELASGDGFGEVESNKSVSQLFAPVGGEVAEINEGLVDNPELVNDDPYGDGWLVKIRIQTKAELTSLLKPWQYSEQLEAGD